MSDDIRVAFIGLIAGVIGGVIAVVGNALLQRQQAGYDERAAQLEAERSYQYDARKKLYTDFQPLMFQLVEACDSASRRLGNLTKASREGHLGLGPDNWLASESDTYYRLSTVYRFVVPVVLFKLCQRRLTFVDLGVDRHVRRQFALARLIYQTWNDGHDLAARTPALRYTPTSRRMNVDAPNAAELADQQVVIGELDLIAEAMAVDGPDGRQRPMDFGEFLAAFSDEGNEVHKRAKVMEDIFRAFRPDRRPVLWRLLLCQWVGWQAFIRSATDPTTTVDFGYVGDATLDKLEWRTEAEKSTKPDVASDLVIASNYAKYEYERAAQFSR